MLNVEEVKRMPSTTPRVPTLCSDNLFHSNWIIGLSNYIRVDGHTTHSALAELTRIQRDESIVQDVEAIKDAKQLNDFLFQSPHTHTQSHSRPGYPLWKQQ